MEKKYLEIYGSTLMGDNKLIGAFENVKDFEESENHLSFRADEGDFEIDKNEKGEWETRVFGKPIKFKTYKLIGRRTMLKKVDPSRLGHSAEIKKQYDQSIAKSQSASARHEQEKQNGEIPSDLSEEEIESLERITDNFTAQSGYGMITYFKDELKPAVKYLRKYYKNVKVRNDERCYWIVFDTLK